MPDPKFPGIPAIQSDAVLAPTVRALVEAVEMLIGVRNSNGTLQAATVTDIRRQLSEIDKRLKALGG